MVIKIMVSRSRTLWRGSQPRFTVDEDSNQSPCDVPRRRLTCNRCPDRRPTFMRTRIACALTGLLTLANGSWPQRRTAHSRTVATSTPGSRRSWLAGVSTAIPVRTPRGSSTSRRRPRHWAAARAGRRSCRASWTKACSGSGSRRTRCRPSRRFPRPRRPRCATGSPAGRAGAPIRSIPTR